MGESAGPDHACEISLEYDRQGKKEAKHIPGLSAGGWGGWGGHRQQPGRAEVSPHWWQIGGACPRYSEFKETVVIQGSVARGSWRS